MESQLLGRFVVLHKYSVPSDEAESLLRRVELGSRVRPAVAVVGDHVATVAHIAVVEEEVGFLDGVAQRNTYAHPAHQLDHLYSPADLVGVH